MEIMYLIDWETLEPSIGGICLCYVKPFICKYTQLVHHDPLIVDAKRAYLFSLDKGGELNIGDYVVKAELTTLQDALIQCNQDNIDEIRSEKIDWLYSKVLSTDYPPLIQKGVSRLKTDSIDLNEVI